MSQFVGVEAIGSAANSTARGAAGSVVVIDVFRAFSLAPLALAQGARKIILVRTFEEALRLKHETPGALAIADGPPREGFELSNSPAALMNADVTGQSLIQRTNAGTQGAVAVGECRALYCASFVCASATADALRSKGQDITYVITGHDGTAAEDLACARFIDALIQNPDIDPAPYLEEARTSPAAEDLREGLRLGYKGIHVRDIDLCLEVDRTDFACTGSREPYGVVLTRSATIA